MTTAEGKVSTEVDSTGVLVVHTKGGDESYDITKIPPATASLVKKAQKEILQDLGLQTVLTDLNRASDLLYLAYLGVIGTGDLHARISSRQKELSDLCGDCVVAMTVLRQGSLNVLERLTEAYSYLLEANEKRALRILGRCAKNAQMMATKCDELAKGFGKLKEETKMDAETAIKAYGNQIGKIKELEKSRGEMQANLKKQEVLRGQLNKDIEATNTDIAKEEAREETAASRAFAATLVGIFAGAIGSGLGAIVSAGGKEVSGEQARRSPQDQMKQGDKADSEKALNEAKGAEDKALDGKREVDRKVVDAESCMKAKEVLLNAAKAADPTQADNEGKLKEARLAFNTSSTNLSRLLSEQKQVQEDLERAKHSVKVSKAALSAPITDMAELGAARGTVFANNRGEMLKRKRELEKLQLDAIGQLAFLTSRLESKTDEINMDKSTQTALEIATWALNNIFVSLNNAKYFWDSMKRFCEGLAGPEVIDRIQDEMDDGSTPEERIKYYKSPRFVSPSVTYVSKWAALTSICEEYVLASQNARRSVLDHIKASPNAEEARKLIKPLKQKLEEELEKAKVAGNKRISDLDTETKEHEQAKVMPKA